MQDIQNKSTPFLSSSPLWPWVPCFQFPRPIKLVLGLRRRISSWTLPEFFVLPPSPVHYVGSFPFAPQQHCLRNFLLYKCHLLLLLLKVFGVWSLDVTVLSELEGRKNRSTSVHGLRQFKPRLKLRVVGMEPSGIRTRSSHGKWVLNLNYVENGFPSLC